jgi:hypothetical protein
MFTSHQLLLAALAASAAAVLWHRTVARSR